MPILLNPSVHPFIRPSQITGMEASEKHRFSGQPELENAQKASQLTTELQKAKAELENSSGRIKELQVSAVKTSTSSDIRLT